jgi:hypothetical protein
MLSIWGIEIKDWVLKFVIKYLRFGIMFYWIQIKVN